MKFTICDKYTYYEERLLPSSKCSVNFIEYDQLKETIFRKCGIQLELVIKGRGNTLYEKALYLYNNCFQKINLGPSFINFYYNLILYGMLKYILARILYGKFNLKYLLSNFNDKFLKNLGHGRFCGFLEAFESCESPIYGFNVFFKSSDPQK